MIISMKEMLTIAKQNKFAVPAFNYDTLEMAKAAIMAASEINSPVIIEASEASADYIGIDILTKMSIQLAEQANIPVVVHYDHGFNKAKVINAINKGWKSVMIDSSSLSFDDNVKNTIDIKTQAVIHNCCVESEIGHVTATTTGNDAAGGLYTDPQEAIKFVKATKCDSLAIAVGTVHGNYKGKINLQIDLIKQIAKLLPDTPLVLHGSSGTPENQLLQAIDAGISKINVGTEVKINMFAAYKSYLATNPNSLDAIELGRFIMTAMKNGMIKKMNLFGCNGKAILFNK